jgi:hypothetical protein
MIRFTDGSHVECSGDNIRKCSYSASQGCTLSLNNGMIISNLDKLSYFGVLKRRLDEMIAQNKQLKSVEEQT